MAAGFILPGPWVPQLRSVQEQEPPLCGAQSVAATSSQWVPPPLLVTLERVRCSLGPSVPALGPRSGERLQCRLCRCQCLWLTPAPPFHGTQRAGQSCLRGWRGAGGALGQMRPSVAESSDLSISPTSPVQLGAAAQELIRNLKAAAEPGALAVVAVGGTAAWPALGAGGAEPAPVTVAFPAPPPSWCGLQGVAGWSLGHHECLWRSAWLRGLSWVRVPLCHRCLRSDVSQVKRWLPLRSVF